MIEDDGEPGWEGFGVEGDPHGRRQGVLDELMREIGRGHPLYGRVVRVEAFFSATDDVIVRLDDGAFAHVHPTWSRRRERPSYPEATLLGSDRAALEFMAR